MKRLHVHVGVEDLDQSIRFYSTLFASEPTVVKPDYAKWMLDDPRVNFAISAGGHAAKGIEHLGIQVESQDELAEVYGRLSVPTGQYLRKARRPVAMPSPKRAGSPIPRASCGRPSTPAAMRQTMAAARSSAHSPITRPTTPAARRPCRPPSRPAAASANGSTSARPNSCGGRLRQPKGMAHEPR